MVHDVVVLVDRDQGAHHRLKQVGINLISILKVDMMMNLYHANAIIDEEQYQAYVAYVRANRPAPSGDAPSGA